MVDQSADVTIDAAGYEAELAVHVEDVLPAADVCVAEFYEIWATSGIMRSASKRSFSTGRSGAYFA